MEIYPLYNETVGTIRQPSAVRNSGAVRMSQEQNGRFLDILHSMAGEKLKSANLDAENSLFASTFDRTSKNMDLAKSFESMIISQMMKPLFAEFAEFTFGEGVESEVYTSLFSDAVADALAERGNLGLEKYFQGVETNNKTLGD